MYQLDDYDYDLPGDLIAQTLATPADSCKLLIYDKHKKTLEDKVFHDLTEHIDTNTLLIFNNSKVVKARLPLLDNTGEIFFLRSIDTYRFEALVRPGKKFKVGHTLSYIGDVCFTVEELTEDGRILICNQPITTVLETYGQMPLPPYITYDTNKEASYQPIIAEKAGSIAAPTASLHFTAHLLEQLEQQGIHMMTTTLHVGLGTFKPVNTDNITHYDIHTETIEIDIAVIQKIALQKQAQQPILAIGTTVVRTLESLPYLIRYCQEYHPHIIEALGKHMHMWEHIVHDIDITTAKEYIQDIHYENTSIRFSSKLYLYPSRPFYIIDQLITNFHLPKSSLLMLVAGFVGYEEMKEIYTHAIQQNYKFYSFGDALWIQ